MKKIYVVLLMVLITIPTLANSTKLRIAVFDPTISGTFIDTGTKVAIREIISSTIVNTGNYDLVERSLLEKVLEEQQFSNSGIVDDNDATEIGKLAGANKIVLSIVSSIDELKMLSVKIIDVKTASVDRQKVKVINSVELLNMVEPLILELFNEETEEVNNSLSKTIVLESVNNDVAENLVPKNNELLFYLPPYKNANDELPTSFLQEPISVLLDKELKFRI